VSDQNHPEAGVGIIVLRDIDGKQHVMMHQRRGKWAHGYWGTGGGHMELGESLLDGALRELREEAGENVKVRDVQFLCAVNVTEFPPEQYVDINFIATWESGEPQNTEPDKVGDWQWLPLDDLPSPLLPSVAKGLEALRTDQKLFDSSF